MRILSIMTVAGIAAMAMAQQPNQPRAPQPDKTFTSAADVEAMIAKAKSAAGSPIRLTLISR